MTVLLVCWRRRLCRSLFLLPVILLLIHVCIAPQAGAAAKSKELLIGIEPEHNIFDQVQRYRALAGYLSDQLGLQVKLTIMSRYGEVVNRFKSLHLDGALLSSYTSMLAINELDLRPIANLVNLKGEATSKGYVFVRKDSGIDSVDDMRGKSVVFVDKATTEGYVYAMSLFRQHGIYDLDSYLGRHYFSGSHASAVFAVLDGRADVGSAKDTVFEQLMSNDPSMRQELNIIGQSPAVPELTLCIKSDVDPQVLGKLRTSLLNMGQTVEGHKVLKQLEARSFVLSSSDDFAVVSEMAEDAGVNMLNSDNN